MMSGFPSPSKSDILTDSGDVPVVTSLFTAKALDVNALPPPVKVTLNGFEEAAIKLLTVTVIGK